MLDWLLLRLAQRFNRWAELPNDEKYAPFAAALRKLHAARYSVAEDKVTIRILRGGEYIVEVDLWDGPGDPPAVTVDVRGEA